MDPLVVGFDLDMTLIDSRPGIGAVYEALAAETGFPVDVQAVTSRLGPPLEHEMVNWFPAEQIPALVERYRALYPDLAIRKIQALAGAHEALSAVAAHGGSTLVVTAKNGPDALLHVKHLDLPVDHVVGGLWAEQKATALIAHGAAIYVGDHLSDIAAAKAANAICVAVATGPIASADLAAAGADVVLEDLSAFPQWLDEYVLDTRLAELDRALAGLGSVVVAFSGGADSAFLLAAAVRALGADNVVAATAVSSSLPSAELDQAAAFARDLGVRHLTPSTHEMDRDGYRANAGDRCYFCKAELLDVVGPLAAELGIAAVATGTNADDAVAGFRPGIRAASERGAVTPLKDAALTKAQIRAASKRWGLSTWDKPAAACLSSRIAYGIQITPSRLARVEAAESTLRASLVAAGFDVQNLRVRDLGDTARVEIDANLIADLAARPELLANIEGFSEVVVDSRGFRSGSMNELLPDPARFR